MIKMSAGLDIGNGYVKGKVTTNGKEAVFIDAPSTVSYHTGAELPRQAHDRDFEDFINQMDATVISKGIKPVDEGRVYFGRRAIESGGSQVEFNIDNPEPKSQDSLSATLILGSIASLALTDYWKANRRLPKDTLDVSVGVGLALPIEDYLTYRDQYEAMLMGSTHHVHIHNFEDPVVVQIAFEDVKVLAEGAAGQYAITSLGADFLQMALDDTRRNGIEIDEAYTGRMLSRAENTIGIDIGDGTTNFPVFTNANVAIETSSSIPKGFGVVLTNVVTELRNTAHSFESRKDLADFLVKENLKPNQERIMQRVRVHLDKQIKIFVRDVIKEYANIFRKVGIRTDVIYVYGGGANAVKNYLHPMLVASSEIDDGYSLPIIYLDSDYSRDLNRNGLFEIARLSNVARNG